MSCGIPLGDYYRRYQTLTPYEFEDMVAEFLRQLGWLNVVVTPRSNDSGRDVIGEINGTRTYIEVKQHHDLIGRPVVQKLHSIMTLHQVRAGMIITTSSFSAPAIMYAHETKIKLIDGTTFLQMCRKLIGLDAHLINFNEMCKLLDQNQLNLLCQEFVKKYVFTYPPVPNDNIQFKIGNITAHRHTLAKFSYSEVFVNSSKYPIFTYNIQNKFVSIGLPKYTGVCQVNPFEPMTTISEMRKNGWNYTFNPDQYPPMSIPQIKEYLQNFYSTNAFYTGKNNVRYSKYCVPNLNLFNLNSIGQYWMMEFDMTHFWFKFHFHDDRIESFPFKLDKSNYFCSDCKRIYRTRLNLCEKCGKVICPKCRFKFFHHFWSHTLCMECKSKYFDKKSNKIEKNTELIHQVKNSFKKWKRMN